MALDKDFLLTVIPELTDEQAEKILGEAKNDLTGLKANRDKALAELKTLKEKNEGLVSELDKEKAELTKKIEDLEQRVKSTGTDEAKAYYEAELKKSQNMYAAKYTELETNYGKTKAEKADLETQYLGLLVDAELEKALGKVQTASPLDREIIRTMIKAAHTFDRTEVEGEMKLLNKDSRTIPDVVNAFMASDVGKRFLPFNNAGGGAPGGATPRAPATGNPYEKATWNFTLQNKLEKEEPVKAARLKAEAATGK